MELLLLRAKPDVTIPRRSESRTGSTTANSSRGCACSLLRLELVTLVGLPLVTALEWLSARKRQREVTESLIISPDSICERVGRGGMVSYVTQSPDELHDVGGDQNCTVVAGSDDQHALPCTRNLRNVMTDRPPLEEPVRLSCLEQVTHFASNNAYPAWRSTRFVSYRTSRPTRRAHSSRRR